MPDLKLSAIKAQSPIASKTNLFTVSGPVLVHAIIGQVKTVIQTQANNTKLTFTPTITGGSATDLCAVLNISATAVGKSLWLDGVKATALQVSTDAGITITSAGHMPIALIAGTINVSCTASNTGNVAWRVLYEPLEEGAEVV